MDAVASLSFAVLEKRSRTFAIDVDVDMLMTFLSRLERPARLNTLRPHLSNMQRGLDFCLGWLTYLMD